MIIKPRQVLVIRHAEKTGPSAGVSLNLRGCQRAAALPRLFPCPFDTPDFILAAAPTKRSNRPVETVAPLAASLYLEIDVRFRKEDILGIASELFSDPAYAAKTILVCWHHKGIPALAKALGVPDPPLWDERRFDRVWRIEFLEERAALTDLPQLLLEGDS
jgi:hypothetical protein